MQPRNLPSTYFTFPNVWKTFCELPLTFSASARPYINFYQHSLCPRDLASNSVKFPCVRWTCQLQSTFCSSMGNSVNFSCVCRTFRQLLSTLRASTGLSVIFRQLSTCQLDLLSNIHSSRDLTSSSSNFPSICGKFRQFSWTFCASAGSFFNYRKFSLHLLNLPSNSIKFPCLKDLVSISINFRTSAETFVNLLCYCGTFRQLPSTFCTSA